MILPFTRFEETNLGIFSFLSSSIQSKHEWRKSKVISILNADGNVSIMSIMYSQIHRLSTKIRRMKRRNVDGSFVLY
ncbi:hypothetical protein CHCC14814_0902 [Bacillus paralicheniformis]|nr:hypothetical protein CHCC14814_0902 [Bacillus paralicheniformis]